jgi:hypothetical protein
MKKSILFFATLLFSAFYGFSQNQEIIEVHSNGSVLYENALQNINTIRFQQGNADFNLIGNRLQAISISEIDSIVFVNYPPILPVIRIAYNDNSVDITNPFEAEGIIAIANQSAVTINATSEYLNVTYIISGSTSNGSLSISSNKDFKILLDNASITSSSLPPINIKSEVSAEIQFNGTNSLSDATANNKKAVITSNGDLVFNGYGTLQLTGLKRHAVSSDKSIRVEKGTIVATVSSAAELTASGSGYDPSCSAALKSDEAITINGGNLQLTCTATATGGRGISAHSDVLINGGNLTVTTAGNGASYTNESGATDSFTAACFKSDANILFLGGVIDCQSSGTGGKGVNADGTITIGNIGADNSALSLTVGTSGARFLVSGSSGGGTGGGGRPGGQSGDYANPKGIKCEGNLTVNSGIIRVNCTQTSEGGEGIESKAVLTINDGDIQVNSYDDCINGGTSVTINGGNIFVAARGQDAIDSNGTLTLNGGLIIANGVKGDGEAFDGQTGKYPINGGVLLGTCGSLMEYPSGPQKTLIYSNATAGNAISIKNAGGETILMYNIPIISGASKGTTGLKLVFSDPRLVTGTYTLLYNGTISSQTSSNGYVTSGSYSGGSTKTFTIGSAAYTTVQ